VGTEGPVGVKPEKKHVICFAVRVPKFRVEKFCVAPKLGVYKFCDSAKRTQNDLVIVMNAMSVTSGRHGSHPRGSKGHSVRGSFVS